MAVKWKTKKDKFPDMIREVQILNGKKVQVGVFEGEHQWLAAIHEYGCDITAKNAQYLTVPVSPASRGKRAWEFQDLFVYTSKSGKKFLARDNNGQLEILYWLTPSVKIPERSFLRSGYDECINDVMKYSDNLLKQVTAGQMSADSFFDALGEMLATKIKTYARDLSDPADWSGTAEGKGSDNPLVDTGGMINGITWKVVQ